MKIFQTPLRVIVFSLALVSCGNADIGDSSSELASSKTEHSSADAPELAIAQNAPKRDNSMQDQATPAANVAFPTCAALETKNADDVSDLFEKHYPAGLVDPDTVDSQQLTPSELTATVKFAACAAAKTNFEPFVADGATALFTSKTYGAAAFAALESISKSPGYIGKAAKEFAEQMRSYAVGPTE